MNNTEKKIEFETRMVELDKIAELSNESTILQLKILDLLTCDDPDALEKIQSLQNEHHILNEKLTSLKNDFDKKYHLVDKEYHYDDRIKKIQ